MNFKITHLVKQTAITMALLLTTAFCVNAATVYVNGIKYTTSGTTAKVAAGDATSGTYTGDIVIPQTIENAGVTYTVTAFDNNAFKDCVDVTSVTIPETLVTFGRSVFKGCTGLTTYPVTEKVIAIGSNCFEGCSALTEAFVPAGISKTMNTSEFKGCTGLKKFTVKDSDTASKLGAIMWGTDNYPPIEELYLGRSTEETANVAPFSVLSTLKKVVVGEKVTSFRSNEFANLTNLTTIEFQGNSALTSIGANAFTNCSSLTSLALPAGITEVANSLFVGCNSLANITFAGNLTSIGNSSFRGLPITSFTFPTSLKSIGKEAFQATQLNTVELNEGLETIGAGAFKEIPTLTSVSIPSTVTSIGAIAFASIQGLASITVADGNATYMAKDNVLYSKDGSVLYLVAAGVTRGTMELTNVKTIDELAFFGVNLAGVNAPVLERINHNAFRNTTTIKNFTIAGNVVLGTEIFENSSIENVVFGEGIKEIPMGTFFRCASLKEVTLPVSLTGIKDSAFFDCSALKSLTLSKNVNFIESNAFDDCGINEIVCKNVNVPVCGEVFADNNGITVKVATSAVEAYKADAQWGKCNIVADSSIPDEKIALGCPTGLYFTTKDTKTIMYLDAEGNIQSTDINVGAHALQLQAYNNRIYCANAGVTTTYRSSSAGNGEGQLVYINKSGDNGFYKTLVVDNVGGDAYRDFYQMFLDKEAGTLYVSGRNEGVRMVDANKIGIWGDDPTYLVQNNWIPYYGVSGLVYGALNAGFHRDAEGLNWWAKKNNGGGIYRFKDTDIYDPEARPTTLPYSVILNNDALSSLFLDEANGYAYIYLIQSTKADPGLYRFSINDLKTIDNITYSNGTLIDGSPVLMEEASDGGLGITQICSDGENIYWGYIAPESSEDPIIGAIPFDAENPLHKSGIKKISAKGGEPVVTYAVENVKAYGVASQEYKAPSAVEDVNADSVKATNCIVKGSSVEVFDDAVVTITNLTGVVFAQKAVYGNGTISLDSLANGLYIVNIVYANGNVESVKVVK